MLKLATRANFHPRTAHIMEMIIALDSSFREVQFWYKVHLILTNRNGILNLIFLMDKLSRSASVKCRLMKPNGYVASPSMKCIHRSDLSLIWTSSQLITSSSLSSLDWFVQLGGFSTSNVWKRTISGLFWRPKISGIRAALTWVAWPCFDFDLEGRILISESHIGLHIFRGDWDSLTSLPSVFDRRNYNSVWLSWPICFWTNFDPLGRPNSSVVDRAAWRTFWGRFAHCWLSCSGCIDCCWLLIWQNCLGHVNSDSLSAELLKNNKKIWSKGFPTLGFVPGICHILCPLVLACLLHMFLCSICIYYQCV